MDYFQIFRALFVLSQIALASYFIYDATKDWKENSIVSSSNSVAFFKQLIN